MGSFILKSWDFASMSGSPNMSGTWDLGLHLNQPLHELIRESN